MKPLALLVLTLSWGAPSARANTSLGGDYTTGQGYRGWDAKAEFEIDSKGDDTVSAEYAHAHSTVGTETKSNQVTLGLDHIVEDNWDFRGALTGWKDDISDVKYIGPSFGATYTLYRDLEFRGPRAKPSENDSDEREDNEEVLSLVYNSDLFFYQTGVNASSHTITQGRGHSARTIVIGPHTGTISLFQFHPTLEVDVPLFNAAITPSVTVGHYFYSKNPDVINQRAGLPVFSASANSMTGLVGGLFLNNGQVGLDINLPSHFKLRGILGLQQLATDYTWATTQGITFSGILFDHLKPYFAWNRSIQDGVRQDLYTMGLTYLF